LTVCNLLVVVTHVYSVLNNGEDLESGYDYSSRKDPLVTVDLGVPTDTSAYDSGLTSVHFISDDPQSTASVGKSS